MLNRFFTHVRGLFSPKKGQQEKETTQKQQKPIPNSLTRKRALKRKKAKLKQKHKKTMSARQPVQPSAGLQPFPPLDNSALPQKEKNPTELTHQETGTSKQIIPLPNEEKKAGFAWVQPPSTLPGQIPCLAYCDDEDEEFINNLQLLSFLDYSFAPQEEGDAISPGTHQDTVTVEQISPLPAQEKKVACALAEQKTILSDQPNYFFYYDKPIPNPDFSPLLNYSDLPEEERKKGLEEKQPIATAGQITSPHSFHKKQVIIFFDIDNTLIDFNKSVNKKREVVWKWGSPDVWVASIKKLIEYAEKRNIDLHFGIATFKSRQDYIAADVINHLAPFLDPELIFFTKARSKVKYALELAKVWISTKYDYAIRNLEIWIIDDLDHVISRARRKGYQAIDAKQKKLSLLFEPLYDYLNLCHKDRTPHVPYPPQAILRALLTYTEQKNYRLIERILKKYPKAHLISQKEGKNVLHFAVATSPPDMNLIKLLAKKEDYLHRETNKKESLLDITINNGSRLITTYLLNNHSNQFTSLQLQRALFSLVENKQRGLAILLLKKSPHVRKKLSPTQCGCLDKWLREPMDDSISLKRIERNEKGILPRSLML